jgi:hypothetical protein
MAGAFDAAKVSVLNGVAARLISFLVWWLLWRWGRI